MQENFEETEDIAYLEELSLKQRNILFGFLKKCHDLEVVEKFQWKELALLLNSDGLEPQRRWDAWRETLMNWKTRTIEKKIRLCMNNGTTDPSGPIPSLSHTEVELLVAVGELKTDDNVTAPADCQIPVKTEKPPDVVELVRGTTEDNKSTAEVCTKLSLVVSHLNRVLTDVADRIVLPGASL